jgi:DNA repair exonuclease SbcCD ATPase subunit
MREIDYKSKMAVLELYFEGFSTNEIVGRSGVSKGSVIAILKDAREGRFPVAGLKGKVDELHALSAKLKKETLDIAQARVGLAFFRRLQALGVGPDKLEEWADFCSHMVRNPPDGFIPAAVEFYHATHERGISYSEMATEVKELQAHYDQLLEEVGDLVGKEARAKELNREIADKGREVQRLEARRDELKAELAQLQCCLEGKATALGMPVAALESRLRELVSLEEKIAARRKERDRLRGQLDSLTQRVESMAARMETASQDFKKDLDALSATRRELLEAGVAKGRLEKEIERMQWAISVMPFLSDPDKVPDDDFSLVAIVVNCLDRWLPTQREFQYRSDPGWSHVKRYVHSKRMELRGASQGSG